LETNGVVDQTFSITNAINDELRALVIQSDGKILIAGRFTTVLSASRNRIARLNSDGTLDGSFDPGTGANGNIRAMALQPDGKIVIAGEFSQVNGLDRAKVARLNASGSVDETFDPGAGPDRQVRTVAVENGSNFLGGDFENYRGVARSTVAKLSGDGSLDSTFDPGASDQDTTRVVLAQTGGGVYVGGIFTQRGGASRTNVALLKSDGSADEDFDVGAGPDNEVFALAKQDEGFLIVAGQFKTFSGMTNGRIARLILTNAPLEPLIRFRPVVTPGVLEGTQTDLTVERVGDLTATATVNYRTGNGTATEGEDFPAGAGVLTFAPGENLKTIRVSVSRDMVIEPVETFYVHLSQPTNALIDSPALAEVQIAEASPVIDFLNAADSVVEGGQACVTLRRSGYLWPETWSVDYELIAETAVEGTDFSGPIRGTVDFTMGNDLRCLPLNIINDGFIEGPKTFRIRLTRATGAVLGANSETRVTILDNDAGIEFVSTNYVQFENGGAITLVVRRGDDGTNAVSIQYFTTDGTAEAGSDYSGVSGTLEFAAGLMTRTITVSILNDCREENDETFRVLINNPTPGYSIGPRNAAEVTIFDSTRPGTVASILKPDLSNPQDIKVQPDGKILIGTWPEEFVPAGGLRLCPDGSWDTGFRPDPIGSGVGAIRKLALTSNGKIILARSNLVYRLFPDGSLDSAFTPQPSGLDYLWDLAIQADGKILIGGFFYVPGAIARLNVDGSVDSSFPIRGGRGPFVRSLAIQKDGRILAGGAFSSFDGAMTTNLVRLNPDGSTDSTFHVAIAGNINGSGINRVIILPDGKILIGGLFESVQGLARTNIARLHPDGSLDTSFDPQGNATAPVLDILIQSNGKLVLRSGDYYAAGLSRLLPDGRRDLAFVADALGSVSDMEIQNDGNLLAGSSRFGLVSVILEHQPHISSRYDSGTHQVQFVFDTRENSTYVLEGSSDLMSWIPLSTNVATGCSMELREPVNRLFRFYRLRDQ
jgi:uncharacterized delta-60 repeat protein